MKLGKGVTGQVVGIAGYAVAEGFLDQFLSGIGGSLPMNIPADALEVILGWYLMKKKGIVGSVGTAMFTINTYNLVKTFAGGVLPGSSEGGF